MAMQKVDMLRLKLDRAAKRHAKWALARPTEHSRQMYDESRQHVIFVATDFGLELSDEYMREDASGRLKASRTKKTR